ncbi:unnamed protein product [Cochlearia groenlandica]
MAKPLDSRASSPTINLSDEKKPEPKSEEIIDNKPNVDNGGEETVSLEKTKRSKKEKKLKSPIADSGEKEEMETDVKDSKRKMFIYLEDEDDRLGTEHTSLISFVVGYIVLSSHPTLDALLSLWRLLFTEAIYAFIIW